MRIKNKRKFVLFLLLLILLLLLIVACIVFILSQLKPSSSASSGALPARISSSQLLGTTVDGRIVAFDPDDREYETLHTDYVYRVTAFDYYFNRTVYYGTRKPNEPVRSLSRSPINSSAPWTKTALAVDYRSDKVYVLDGVRARLYVTDLRGEYYRAVLDGLVEPRDVVLDPRSRLMFVLQKSSIVKAYMDGSSPRKIRDARRKQRIRAIAVDPDNTLLYFATRCAIKSVNYSEPSGQPLTGMILGDEVTSLAVAGERLFFIGVPRNSRDKVLTSCSLEDRICKKVARHTLRANVDSIKALRNEPLDWELRNPCLLDNNGCEHLCLLAAVGCACVCNDGWQLNDDLRSCSPQRRNL